MNPDPIELARWLRNLTESRMHNYREECRAKLEQAASVLESLEAAARDLNTAIDNMWDVSPRMRNSDFIIAPIVTAQTKFTALLSKEQESGE